MEVADFLVHKKVWSISKIVQNKLHVYFRQQMHSYIIWKVPNVHVRRPDVPESHVEPQYCSCKICKRLVTIITNWFTFKVFDSGARIPIANNFNASLVENHFRGFGVYHVIFSGAFPAAPQTTIYFIFHESSKVFSAHRVLHTSFIRISLQSCKRRRM